jgi:two-component sensor histidine kinase
MSIEAEPHLVVSAKQAVALGLIVQEALANSFKHAHPTGVPGAVCIRCRRSGKKNGFVVEISDDGIGLPEGFDPHSTKSLGASVIRSLASQLNASLDFEDTGTGLTIRLTSPGANRQPIHQ